MKGKQKQPPQSTLEPWEATEDYTLRQRGGTATILESPVSVRGTEENLANLARIVACVNGCAGIPTDSLHKVDVITLLRSIGQLEHKVEEGAILIEDAVEAIEQAIEALHQFDQ